MAPGNGVAPGGGAAPGGEIAPGRVWYANNLRTLGAVTRATVAFVRSSEELQPRDDLEIVATITDELGDALRLLADGRAQTLYVESLRSVAGSLGELTRLLGWLDAYDADLLAADVNLDTRTPVGRRTLAVVREIERWGREPESPRRPRGRPGLARTSPDVAERVATLRARGLSLRAIAEDLNAQGIPTPRGGSSWRASSVQAAIGYRRPPPPPPGAPGPPRHPRKPEHADPDPGHGTHPDPGPGPGPGPDGPRHHRKPHR